MKTVLYQIFKQRFLQEGCEINNKISEEDKISEVSLRNLESNNWTLLLLLFIILIEVLENYISIPIFIL
jgi:hypothetical protein